MKKNLVDLGNNLKEECPENDCTIYRNTFLMWEDINETLRGCLMGEHSKHILEKESRRLERDLENMYLFNYAVKQYRSNH
jgi:hypothetical protein